MHIVSPLPVYPMAPQSGHATELKTLPGLPSNVISTPSTANHGDRGSVEVVAGDAKIHELKQEMAQVTTIMHGNLQKAMERGEALTFLNYRTGKTAL